MSDTQNGLWLMFVHKDKVLIPTMARTEAGFYMGVEPVSVIVLQNRAEVRLAFIDTIRRGNPLVPTPTRATYPPDPLLKHANVRTLSAFERSAKGWKLGRSSAEYVIAPYRTGESGGSEEDSREKESFPADVPVDQVVSRLLDRALGSGTGAR